MLGLRGLLPQKSGEVPRDGGVGRIRQAYFRESCFAPLGQILAGDCGKKAFAQDSIHIFAQ